MLWFTVFKLTVTNWDFKESTIIKQSRLQTFSILFCQKVWSLFSICMSKLSCQTWVLLSVPWCKCFPYVVKKMWRTICYVMFSLFWDNFKFNTEAKYCDFFPEIPRPRCGWIGPGSLGSSLPQELTKRQTEYEGSVLMEQMLSQSNLTLPVSKETTCSFHSRRRREKGVPIPPCVFRQHDVTFLLSGVGFSPAHWNIWLRWEKCSGRPYTASPLLPHEREGSLQPVGLGSPCPGLFQCSVGLSRSEIVF